MSLAVKCKNHFRIRILFKRYKDHCARSKERVENLADLIAFYLLEDTETCAKTDLCLPEKYFHTNLYSLTL